MTNRSTLLKRLYLLRVANTLMPLPDGNKLPMSAGCYLVETADGRMILIDSGLPPDAEILATVPPQDQKNVLEYLAELGHQPGNIDMVICTHFDIDHAGNHDAFPQAQFIVQRSHYEQARSHPRFDGARSHWDHPSLRYRFVEGDAELLPGLRLIETSGHVPGHQSVLLHLPRTGAVLLAIDAVTMQSLFTPERAPWPMDMNAVEARASTLKLLDLATHEQASLVVFGHDGSQWQTLKLAPDYYD
jgi:N-acyl homoserine lactone hydrolase